MINLTKFTYCFVSVCGLIACLYKDDLAAKFKPNSSPIDWCESNYSVHSNIAEFWNTLTSFCLMVPSILGYYLYSGTKMEKHEPNVYLLWISTFIISLGSVYFHGTLSVAGQILDELPIIILANFGLFMLFPLHKWKSIEFRNTLFSWQTLVCLNIGGFLLTMLNPAFSHYIVVLMMPLTFGTFLHEFYYCKEKPWKLYGLTLISFGISFLCWTVDKFACSWISDLFISLIGFYPQLHAFWHIFISITIWLVIMTGITMRLSGDKKESKLVYTGMLYMVELV